MTLLCLMLYVHHVVLTVLVWRQEVILEFHFVTSVSEFFLVLTTFRFCLAAFFSQRLQCFDAVGWVSGRASGL